MYKRGHTRETDAQVVDTANELFQNFVILPEVVCGREFSPATVQVLDDLYNVDFVNGIFDILDSL